MPLARAWISGMTTSVRAVEDAMPPIMGTTMRWITSAPVPIVVTDLVAPLRDAIAHNSDTLDLRLYYVAALQPNLRSHA